MEKSTFTVSGETYLLLSPCFNWNPHNLDFILTETCFITTSYETLDVTPVCPTLSIGFYLVPITLTSSLSFSDSWCIFGDDAAYLCTQVWVLAGDSSEWLRYNWCVSLTVNEHRSVGQEAPSLPRLWHLVLARPWMNNSLLCAPVSSTVKWESCPKWFFRRL